LHFWSPILETWRNTPAAIKTTVTAAIGTLIGAWLTSRANAKRRVVDELRALHSAYALTFTVVNKALALKRQSIRPMKERYDAVVSAYDDYMANPVGPLALDLDLQTLSRPRFAGETLERIVFEKCLLGHRGLAAMVSLKDATDDLNLSIDYRNNLISNFQQQPPANHMEKIAFYVGAYRNETVDARFANNVEALSDQVDDCVFFGMLLAEELLNLERKLHGRNWWKYRLNVPRQFPADWSLAKSGNLIPDRSKYADWLRGFKKPPSRWERFIAWIRGPWRRS
jgi:hypothetical protein